MFLTVLPQYSKVSWGVCSLIPRLHLLSMLLKNLNNFLLASNDWSCASDFRMFWKNISCFLLWWKTYTKRYTNNYIISRVKRISLLPLFSFVLSISGYDLENGRMPCEQKYKIKNMAVKNLILILFCFCLLWWLPPVSIVGASCFNYICPCRWF